MSGWVSQRKCAECGHEGPDVDFSAVGLDEYGNPYVVSRALAGGFDVIVCASCSWVLTQMDRERMARSIKRLMRRVLAGQVGA